MDPETNAAVGAAVAEDKTPDVLRAAGFTSGGIEAGSTAASMMSASAVANGGGVAAGSLVSVFQKTGASGGSEDSEDTKCSCQ
ncbi:interferon alpha-inducible protein 27-like protein 2 [Limanda limanda]|uniref:interferon alpha-inducible protein 27-like protein 2 n=1 Tax=Limanda limanda TaxID=27771 RepID=UPI0029C99EDA|nr:interferon alpha-inducible protein 27-like protein 2 [Limanda limanda]